MEEAEVPFLSPSSPFLPFPILLSLHYMILLLTHAPLLHPHTCTSPPPHSSEREGHRTEQNMEQAQPTDPNEEELQLKLALQLSKQQVENDKLRCGHFLSYLHITLCCTLLSTFFQLSAFISSSIHPFPSPLQSLPISF